MIAAALLLAALLGLACLQTEPWEWDDVELVLALERFAPAESRPHPPGFPYYVLLARALKPLAGTPIAACSLVSVLGGVLLLAGVARTARQLLGSARAALGAALLAVSIPPVWFAAGLPTSDASAAALMWLGFGALLSGARSARPAPLAAAGLCHGLALGLRPPALLFLVPPWLAAALALRRRPGALAAGLLAAAAAAVPAVVVLARACGGLGPLLDLFRSYQAEAAGRDNLFAALATEPARRVAASWTILLFGGPALGLWWIGWGIFGLRRSSRGPVLAAVLAAPVFAVLVLRMNHHWAARYSLPLLPIAPIAAVAGWRALARRLRAPLLPQVLGLASFLAQAAWMAPHIAALRRDRPPPARALDELARLARRRPLLAWLPGEMGAHLRILPAQASGLLDWHRPLADPVPWTLHRLADRVPPRLRILLLSTQALPRRRPLFSFTRPALGFAALARGRMLHVEAHDLEDPALPFTGWFAREVDAVGWFEVGRRRATLLLPCPRRARGRLRAQLSFYRLLPGRERLQAEVRAVLAPSRHAPAGPGPSFPAGRLTGSRPLELDLELPAVGPGWICLRLELEFGSTRPADPRVLELRHPTWTQRAD